MESAQFLRKLLQPFELSPGLLDNASYSTTPESNLPEGQAVNKYFSNGQNPACAKKINSLQCVLR